MRTSSMKFTSGTYVPTDHNWWGCPYSRVSNSLRLPSKIWKFVMVSVCALSGTFSKSSISKVAYIMHLLYNARYNKHAVGDLCMGNKDLQQRRDALLIRRGFNARVQDKVSWKAKVYRAVSIRSGRKARTI